MFCHLKATNQISKPFFFINIIQTGKHCPNTFVTFITKFKKWWKTFISCWIVSFSKFVNLLFMSFFVMHVGLLRIAEMHFLSFSFDFFDITCLFWHVLALSGMVWLLFYDTNKIHRTASNSCTTAIALENYEKSFCVSSKQQLK